jgi:hypothetical protein
VGGTEEMGIQKFRADQFFKEVKGLLLLVVLGYILRRMAPYKRESLPGIQRDLPYE